MPSSPAPNVLEPDGKLSLVDVSANGVEKRATLLNLNQRLLGAGEGGQKGCSGAEKSGNALCNNVSVLSCSRATRRAWLHWVGGVARLLQMTRPSPSDVDMRGTAGVVCTSDYPIAANGAR